METENTQNPREQKEEETVVTPEPVEIAQETLEETPLLEPVPFYHKKSFWIAVIVVVLVLVGAYFVVTKNIFSSAVAEVNGMKITQAEFEESLSLIKQSAALQGVNLADLASEDMIKEQALDVLINNALLVTAAQSAGITASDAEIQQKYNELLASVGTESVLEEKMAEVGLTKEKLQRNIRDRILADKYLGSVTDIENLTVSDEEILSFYNSIPDDGRVVPPLEEVKEELSVGLKLQKQQQLLEGVLQDLRNAATIERNI